MCDPVPIIFLNPVPLRRWRQGQIQKKFRNFMSNNFTTIKSRLATLIYVVVPIILTQSIAVVATTTIKFFPPQTSLLLDLY